MMNGVIGDLGDMDLPNSKNWSNPFSLREYPKGINTQRA